jgi:hypothetical protein
VSRILSPKYDHDATEFEVDLRDIYGIEETGYSIDVRFDVPGIFYSTSLEDIINGNINIEAV